MTRSLVKFVLISIDYNGSMKKRIDKKRAPFLIKNNRKQIFPKGLMSVLIIGLLLVLGGYWINLQNSAATNVSPSVKALGITTTSPTITEYASVASSLRTNNVVIEKTIASGLKLVGISPYMYGGGRTSNSIAKNEYDCSSFVAQMYRLGGQSIVQQSVATTYLLAQTGTSISWSNKTRGDLLVTAANAPENEQHVAIYLGDGYILHDSTSTNGVNISKLDQVINKSVLGNMTWADLFRSGTIQREVS